MMAFFLSTTLSTIVTFGLPVLLTYYNGIWKWFDLLLRICLAEKNRSANIKRLAGSVASSEKIQEVAQTVISVVGYREDLETYEKSLRSLADAGGAILIAGIDGNSEEDMPMVRVCEQV
jgi:hypothetical protein